MKSELGLMGDCGARCGQLVQSDATGRIGLVRERISLIEQRRE